MEDAATAEISRAQLWQWVHRGATLEDGRPIDAGLYRELLGQELSALGGDGQGRMRQAVELLDSLVLSPGFTLFLTSEAYRLLD
jgi:malate synthase